MVTMLVDALWRVVVVSLLLGAGLPAVFALGVRAMAYGTGASTDGPRAARHPIGYLLGFLCFAAVLAATAAGISVILASGLGMTVTFEHVIPMFTPKGN